MKSKNLLHDIGKNYEAGSYTPCFFITKISTHKIKYHDFDENEKATHLHEYIHFIQDISTYYGILSILTKLSNICLNFHDLSKNKTNIKKEFENNIEFTCCLEETLGEIPDNEDDISSYQINDIKYGENSYPSIDKKTVYYEIVLVDDQYEKEQRIKF